MSITMPYLNFNLLVELSTAINDFSFMEIHDVTIINKGSNIGAGPGGNLNPSPKYESSDGVNFKDRAILDFGNLTVSQFRRQTIPPRMPHQALTGAKSG